MESLYAISQRRIAGVKTAFHRYLFDKIEWDDRLIAIKGPRGTGKTTMMLLAASRGGSCSVAKIS